MLIDKVTQAERKLTGVCLVCGNNEKTIIGDSILSLEGVKPFKPSLVCTICASNGIMTVSG